MKRFTNILLTLGLILPMLVFSTITRAQKQVDDLQKGQDTIKEHVATLGDKISGVEERLATAEADVAKLTKIKISGYVQAQWQHFEQSSVYPNNLFSVRRARFKLQYEPAQGVVFVLQPDFQPGNFVVKEAYTKLNDPWLKTFSLWVGKFNRPNYEVEYSSSDLEALERSRVITTLYPGEYAIGAKLEVAPPKLPLKFQLAVLNGNDGLTINDASGVNLNATDNKEFDNFKDLMARLTYSFKLGKWGGLTVGAHGYYGFLKATTDTLIKSDYTKDKTVKVGSALNRNWFGVEAQFYADILGGLIVKGEYITGMNAFPGFSGSSTATTVANSLNKTGDTLTITTTNTKTTTIRPNMNRNFAGYYVYLIKNIGKRNQFTIRYDSYDPNTKLAGTDLGVVGYKGSPATKTTTTTVGKGTTLLSTVNKTVVNNTYMSSATDLAYSQLSLCWTYYFDDNIKISLDYDIPMNEKTTAGKVTSTYTVNNVGGAYDYSNLIKQNVLTLRLQAKF